MTAIKGMKILYDAFKNASLYLLRIDIQIMGCSVIGLSDKVHTPVKYLRKIQSLKRQGLLIYGFFACSGSTATRTVFPPLLLLRYMALSARSKINGLSDITPSNIAMPKLAKL